MTRDEIFTRIQATISELFEIDASKITLSSRVFQDLDLDSIDAIDLIARLQQITNRRVEEPEMRQVRTVSDIVDIVERQLSLSSPDKKAKPPAVES